LKPIQNHLEANNPPTEYALLLPKEYEQGYGYQKMRWRLIVFGSSTVLLQQLSIRQDGTG